jgi:hypothetical protein
MDQSEKVKTRPEALNETPEQKKKRQLRNKRKAYEKTLNETAAQAFQRKQRRRKARKNRLLKKSRI